MLRGEDIIVFSCGPWERGPSSQQQLSIHFAEKNKVLLIETFGSRFPSLNRTDIKRIARSLQRWFKGLIKRRATAEGVLYTYSPITLLIRSPVLTFMNRLVYLSIIKRLIKKLDMKNPILFFYLPPPLGVIEELPKKAVIYICVDEWLTFPGGKNKNLIDSERRLIEEADLVLVLNKLLYERKKQHARRIYKIYHGVDYDHYAKEIADSVPLPEDIKNIPRPIIAVIGNFADWVDLDLVKLIAQSHKEWSIISIGPVDSNINIRDLIKMGNIYFFGKKDYSELPNYYRAIDAFILPFLLTEHIKYCAPTRFYEHLSSGKPVISTDFPAAREIEKGLIDIATDKEDFVKKIEMALNEKDASLSERRKALAKENTWASRVEYISKLIEDILKIKKVNEID